MTSEIPEDYFVKAENPGNLNAAVAKALSPEVTVPDIPNPPMDEVDLPGGFLTRTGELAARARVRELTGADEEAIARARLSGNVVRIISTLLECGTVEVGGVQATKEVLDQMLVGDREALLLGIRIATYGPELEMQQIRCPSCSELFDVTLRLDELEVRRLDDPRADRAFVVALRRGRRAHVQLATGRDQALAIEKPNLSVPERNTLLLSRCVVSILDADGTERPVLGQPGPVRDLSIADRETILDELRRREPGPQYQQVTFAHNTCGGEVSIALEMSDLFRGL